MERKDLIIIATEINNVRNLGIERMSRKSTSDLEKFVTKHTLDGNVSDLCDATKIALGYPVGPTPAPVKSKELRFPNKGVVGKKPGIEKTLFGFVNEAVENGQRIVVEDLHARLCKIFPERNPAALLSTIRTQIPCDMSKERRLVFTKVNKGIFIVTRMAD